jgi:pimeloyl-ACP methyl ester carboxylesterase
MVGGIEINVENISTKKSTFHQSTVTSPDGTTIGYKSIGKGPGIILVHGVLSDSEDLTALAYELSDSFMLHLIDRRGRGKSGPKGMEYSIQKECEDVKAIQERTNANYLIGHSFGGLVSLELARRDHTFKKLALYDPGVSVVPKNWGWIESYQRAIDDNELREAFTIFVRGFGHTPLTRLPKWYAKLILGVMVRGERWVKIAQLLTENLREHLETIRLEGTHENYRDVLADVLLMSGTKSPMDFRHIIPVLDQIIAKSRTIIIPKLDHFGPNNEGSPVEVAKHLRKFFIGPATSN